MFCLCVVAFFPILCFLFFLGGGGGGGGKSMLICIRIEASGMGALVEAQARFREGCLPILDLSVSPKSNPGHETGLPHPCAP